MRISAAYALATAVLSFASLCFGIPNGAPHGSVLPSVFPPGPTEGPVLPGHAKRAPSSSKRQPKFKKRPWPHPQPPPRRPPQGGCTITNLIQNGNFNKNIKGWDVVHSYSTQFFWIGDSETRPAHSGSGQGYLFANKGNSFAQLTTTIPAVDYGNSIKVTAWVRLGTKVDLSSCPLVMTDNALTFLEIVPTTQWNSYTFEVTGTGRPKEIRFIFQCNDVPGPTSIYIDDVSAAACIVKPPNADCQLVPGSDNFLVDPGFECPGAITAWKSGSLGFGSENITQLVAQKRNIPHSGTGMAGLFLDSSQLPTPGSGLFLYQDHIDVVTTRATVKASFWLAADANLHNMAGCLLSVATSSGYVVQDLSIGNLTTRWTLYEFKGIYANAGDTFEITIYGCTSLSQPLIYLDDVYYGVDKSASPAPTPTPPSTTTAAAVCTSTPFVVDPEFEIGSTSNWFLYDYSPNNDATFAEDETSVYGPPHSGSGVGVLDLPSNSGSISLLQQIYGLCINQAYTATIWFLIPIDYDPALCTINVYTDTDSGPVKAAAAGAWTKIQFTFLGLPQLLTPYLGVDVVCQNTAEMIMLFDDISIGPAPPCSITPTLTDGGFESGDTAIWNPSTIEGDETFTIGNTNPRTGKKSGVLTFPSTSNGIQFNRDFDACIGGAYTFHLWYLVPKAYKGTVCQAVGSALLATQTSTQQINVYDQWTEFKLDFVAGLATETVIFGIECENRLQKVVVYMDDVSVTKA